MSNKKENGHSKQTNSPDFYLEIQGLEFYEKTRSWEFND